MGSPGWVNNSLHDELGELRLGHGWGEHGGPASARGEVAHAAQRTA